MRGSPLCGAQRHHPSWPITDAQGSPIALTDATGAATQINTWDDYGRPAAGNAGRFGYTGQLNLPGAGIQHYKARAYDPALGRFLQTDPVGYEQGLNLYAYVGLDPINGVDPTGTEIRVSSTVSALDSGATRTTIYIDFTAALNVVGTDLPPGANLQDLAQGLEGDIERDFSATYTDRKTGDIVEYKVRATITTGNAQGSQHQISIVRPGSRLLGRYGNIGFAPGFDAGNTAYVASSQVSMLGFYRTGSHEVGHLFGLQHPSGPPWQDNLMTQSQHSSSRSLTRSQRQSIYNNPRFR